MTADTAPLSSSFISSLVLIADLLIRIGFSARIISRKRSYGVTIAWLLIILLFPFLGAFFYLLLGENRISGKKVRLLAKATEQFQRWIQNLNQEEDKHFTAESLRYSHIIRQANTLIGLPAMHGNNLQLLSSAQETIASMVHDINNAQSSCHLQFYIWLEYGMVDDLMQALIMAAQRGVTCRVLVDAIGSRDFLRGKGAERLRKAGIHLRASLPVGIVKGLFSRIDIRNHRKCMIIDGEIAYTGSQNMVDPTIFKQRAGVGQWVDLMIRFTGPSVEPLAGAFIHDWLLETPTELNHLQKTQNPLDLLRKLVDLHPQPQSGTNLVQVVPSGPGNNPEAIHKLLITTIYSARHELIVTTPYFVPDEQILTALKSAAERGVRVCIILPRHNDSKLAHFASQAHFEDLLQAGVHLYLFDKGLLHSKSITVDGELSLFGSVNLDMRSFWLNFEITLFIYDTEFTSVIKNQQFSYMRESYSLSLGDIVKRPLAIRLQENLALLFGPLL